MYKYLAINIKKIYLRNRALVKETKHCKICDDQNTMVS